MKYNMVAQRQITQQQKVILETLGRHVKEMETSNDLQYALKGYGT